MEIFDHLGGLADVQDFVDKRKQKLSFLSIFLLSLVCVPPNKPVKMIKYFVADEVPRCQRH